MSKKNQKKIKSTKAFHKRQSKRMEFSAASFIFALCLFITGYLTGFFWAFVTAGSLLFLSVWGINYYQGKIELRSFLDVRSEYHKILVKILNALKDNDMSLKVETPDNIPYLIQSYEDIFMNLKDSITGLKNSNIQQQKISFDLSASIRALVETGNSQASGSSQQASSVAEITSTMEELARTAAQIADNSNRVARQAEGSESASQEGFQLVHTVINSIETINEKMNRISEKTQILGNQSRQIGKVLEIIYDIANETHLLALNAAIEAVAAGEFGKRFSVVATEVRRLAEISRENAESSKPVIEEFQNSIDQTILSIEEGSKLTSEVNRTAKEIIQNLENISTAVGKTSQSSSEISIATQQQRSASDQIVLTLKDVATVTKQQAGELKNSSKELSKLNDLALSLQLITQQYIIDSPLSLTWMMKTFIKNEELKSEDTKIQSRMLNQIVEENPYIELVCIADAEGVIKNFTLGNVAENTEPNIAIGQNCSSRTWFTNAIKRRAPYLTEIYQSLLTNEYCFSVSCSILDKNRKATGVLNIDINTKMWNKIMSR